MGDAILRIFNGKYTTKIFQEFGGLLRVIVSVWNPGTGF